MVNSNQRKLALSGWLMNNAANEYTSALKHQKFLFFYESISKVDDGEADFSGLKGYERGPVFSAVWGDRQHEPASFTEAARDAYNNPNISSQINNERAKICQFIVSVFTDRELSDITHVMNIWKSKEPSIMSRNNVELYEDDFNENDYRIIKRLQTAFHIDTVNNSVVIPIGSNSFVLSKQDSLKLDAQHYDILWQIAEEEILENPIYIELDGDGAIIVD